MRSSFWKIWWLCTWMLHNLDYQISASVDVNWFCWNGRSYLKVLILNHYSQKWSRYVGDIAMPILVQGPTDSWLHCIHLLPVGKWLQIHFNHSQAQCMSPCNPCVCILQNVHTYTYNIITWYRLFAIHFLEIKCHPGCFLVMKPQF